MRHRTTLASLLALTLFSTAAQAQTLTFTARNGQNTVYCGATPGGPAIQLNYSSPAPTHDPIAVSDPGTPDMPSSAASAQLDATPTQFGLSLSGVGSATRGALQGAGFGAAATAALRDGWTFTVSMPVRFSFSASMNGTSTQSNAPFVAYLFVPASGGGQVVLDPGTPPGVLSGALTGPGSSSAGFGGTLTPGSYYVEIQGRVEGVNVWPYTGSFDVSATLQLTCGPMTSYCTAGTTTNGCAAHIQGSGTPSGSAASGFALDVVGLEGATQGLIFYGVSGRSAFPWGTSSSLVCVKSPTQRMNVLSAGGTPGACNGAMSIDWNSFVANNPGALGAPFSAGQLVQAQAWFRDPPSPKSTMLSDALEFAVCP